MTVTGLKVNHLNEMSVYEHEGLESLQHAVGGLVTTIELPRWGHTDMWLNDEGAYLLAKETNYAAMDIAVAGGQFHHIFQPLFGTVVLLGCDENGHSTSLGPKASRDIMNLLTEAGVRDVILEKEDG